MNRRRRRKKKNCTDLKTKVKQLIFIIGKRKEIHYSTTKNTGLIIIMFKKIVVEHQMDFVLKIEIKKYYNFTNKIYLMDNMDI